MNIRPYFAHSLCLQLLLWGFACLPATAEKWDQIRMSDGQLSDYDVDADSLVKTVQSNTTIAEFWFADFVGDAYTILDCSTWQAQIIKTRDYDTKQINYPAADKSPWKLDASDSHDAALHRYVCGY